MHASEMASSFHLEISHIDTLCVWNVEMITYKCYQLEANVYPVKTTGLPGASFMKRT